MKPFFFPGLIALFVGVLSGCTSVPIHYYTLQSSAPPVAAANVAPAAYRIDVLPVGIPAQLDQSSLVIRQGEYGVTVLDAERWASPYGDELRSALSADLSRQLGTIDVAGLPAPQDAAVLRIKVQVRRLDAWPGQQVQLDADWSLGFANEQHRTSLTCRGTFSVPAKKGYTELVGAEQNLIHALTARMAADVHRLMQSPGTGCSATPKETEGISS